MIRILGPLAVDGVASRDLGGPRPQGLLAALAVEFPQAVSRDRLVDLLWRVPPPSAAAAVHVYVSQLRRALAPSIAVVERAASGYRLNGPDDLVDAARVEATVRRARLLLADGRSVEVRRALDGLDEALRLFRGPPLEGLTSQPFAPPAAERLDELRLQAAKLRVECQLELGLELVTVADLDRLLGEHPYDEELWRLSALALYRSSRQRDALETLQRARRVLAADLGVEPGPGLRDLERAILDHDPALGHRSGRAGAAGRDLPASVAARRGESGRSHEGEDGTGGPGPEGGTCAVERPDPGPAPPAATGRGAAWRKGHWPTYHTSFVGRARELGVLGELLGSRRLVTVVGPAGLGKSRLAAELEAHPPPGTVLPTSRLFVEATETSSVEEVLAAFARALGESAAARGVDQLCRLLGNASWLVVVDRCEEAVPALSPVLSGILRHCPATHVLCTSRQALGIPLECVWELPPLGGESGPASSDRPDVALFLERADRAGGGLAVTDRTAVLGVVAQLDGLPLAIEIAAGATVALPLAELAGRLQGGLRLALPAEPGVDPDRRHSNLGRALRSSYELLPAPEQALLRALSVFPGPFSLGDADDLLRRAEARGTDVALGLQRLVGVSLLPRPQAGRQRPYRLLDSVRVFSAERLAEEPEEENRLRRAHAEVQLDLARTAAPALDGPEPARCSALLDDREPDLSEAAAWLAAHGAREPSAEIELLLVIHLLYRYRHADGRTRASALLADPGLEPSTRAKAAWMLAMHSIMADDYHGAGRACEAGIELVRSREEPVLGLLLVELAEVLRTRDQDRERAATLLDEAAALAAALRDARLDLEVARVRLTLAWDAGDFEEAERAGRHWRRVATSLRHARGVAEASVHLGAVLLAQGRPAAAETQFRSASEFFSEAGDPFSVAYLVYCRARVAQDLGRHDEARALAEEACRHFSVLGDAFGQSVSTRVRGESAHALGHLAEAEVDLRLALELADGPGYSDDAALAANALARLLLDTGDLAEAAALCQQGLETLDPSRPSRIRGPLLATLARALLADGQESAATGALREAATECRRTRWSYALAQLAEAEAAWRAQPGSDRGRPRPLLRSGGLDTGVRLAESDVGPPQG
jgi:DNA-binding SARP family transcriptional activator/predicted ATPase